jgi:alpha-galactosidase/6-phospho-beta-glucosidase family protein
MAKITLVGAGSIVFAKNLICDILQYPSLSDSTIALMDIEPGRLANTERLARRVVAQLGVKARIEATLDLRAACQGAKFVITTIQVGGYKPSTVVDFEIPARYGVQQTIADTLGVGGVFRALRSIPELVKVARTLQEVGAPDAVLLNYTNPMAMCMWAIDRMTGIDSVGLCHSVQGTSQQLARYCGLDDKDVSYLAAGINHMAFFLEFKYKGKDAYPFLFRALEDPGVAACDRVRFEMMRRLGYFVTESSEHQSEYVPYFIHHGSEVIEKFGIPINEYIRRCESQIASWGILEQDLLDESKPVKISRSVEYGSTIIHSMVTGQPSVIYGNVPNTGLIDNLVEGCSVEVPCLVDQQGIQPTHIGKLPPQLAAIIRTNLNVQELTVEAAVTGRRDYIYQAVMADPHTATVLTLDKIWAMCDDLIEAHQKDGFLGEFQPVQRNTGKPLAAVSRVFLSVQPVGVPFAAGSNKAAFQLVAENETAGAFGGEVEIEIAGAPCAITPSGKFSVEVAAGAKVVLPFTIESESEIAGDLTLAIVSESPVTIARDFFLPKRNQLAIPMTNSGKNPLPIEVKWSGNTVARGSAWLTPQELVVELRVEDTDVKPDPTGNWWEGSAIQIGLLDPALPEAHIVKELVILPDLKNPEIHFERKPYAGAKVTVSGDSSGYSTTAHIDLAAAGLTPMTPFLFEMIFHVNALGTAHGKIRQPWQGAQNLWNGQSHFALAVPYVPD